MPGCIALSGPEVARLAADALSREDGHRLCASVEAACGLVVPRQALHRVGERWCRGPRRSGAGCAGRGLLLCLVCARMRDAGGRGRRGLLPRVLLPAVGRQAAPHQPHPLPVRWRQRARMCCAHCAPLPPRCT